MLSDQAQQPNLANLTPYQSRTFVPDSADLCNHNQVVGLYRQLIETTIDSTEQLEQFLRNRSELDAALDQQNSILYIRMTCQTDDQDRAAAYKHFIEIIEPAVKPLTQQLDEKFLTAWEHYPLNESQYHIYLRATQTDVRLFREENIQLQTRETLLSQKYQTLCGAMTVNFQGHTRTMPEMRKLLLEPDRNLRQTAWQATSQRYLKDKDLLEDILDEMIRLRHQIATHAGFDNYLEYQFQRLHRFDYTPKTCRIYHEAVEKHLLPLQREIYQRRARQMNLTSLKPWDLSNDPLSRLPLEPFKKIDQLVGGSTNVFKQIDRELGDQFQQMTQMNLLDLASRKGKAPGGYQSNLAEARKPFIFMNAVGTNDDILTLFHEGGHAFHAFAASAQPLHAYRHAPIEFCEVASMSMELLALSHLSTFYEDKDVQRACRERLEIVFFRHCWVATIDAFQHWLYENPQHNRSERAKVWLQIHNRFLGQLVDWSSCEQDQAYLWHRQLHIFEVPLYYIEYGIAELGALQLWLNSRQDHASAIAAYKKALALGGSRPLPELFAVADLQFDFSAKTIKPLAKALMNQLEAMED